MSPERKMIDTCVCHKIRMAARAVTRAYDDALRPTGLRATQASLLAAVALDGAMSITALAAIIGMDRSTLTRNLGPLKDEGLIEISAEGWRRSRMLKITQQGRLRLKHAMPLWEDAQKHLKQELGSPKWSEVQGDLEHLIQVTSRSASRATG